MHTENINTDNSRLFLAFAAEQLHAPIAQLQAQLQAQQTWSGRAVPLAHLHLTLRFLGQLNGTQAASLLRQLASIKLPAFTLQLDQLGYFPGVNLIWVGPSLVPTALSDLYQDLSLRCASLRIAQPHKAYRPHISLYRHIEPAGLPDLPLIKPIVYQPRQLCLYRSVPSAQGSDYQLEASWPCGQH